MANKAIGQYTQTTDPQEDDQILLQRGNDYFHIEHSDLGFGLKRVSLTLTQTDILTNGLNSVPVELLPAPGAGIYYIPVRAYAIREAGTAYATNTTPQIYFETSGVANYLYRWSSILVETAKTVRTAEEANLDNEDLLANDRIMVGQTSDATAGTNGLTIVLYYEERAL